ncbi:hypothetical protein QBC46DRAFT_319305 [Diplogelasinospora grovesii]|uniref:DUF7907 domain-containing protein n=1 Tax=Diplogelasinospora grovesii TaxID=303347 RepID=A0AAN6N228_9PEZI|nr:hypothetical protein QBC46DRAFT_319305 [Diplogelasinospora grovesii]
MKSTLKTGILAALTASTTVLAQNYNQTGPFLLQVKSANNETLDGQYLYACHAGAAIEGLCLNGKAVPNMLAAGTQFYWNYTTYQGNAAPTGPLVWNLPLSMDGSVTYASSPMSLQYYSFTNVAVPLFEPGYGSDAAQVGFDNDTIYMLEWFNDSTFVAGQYPTQTSQQIQNWHVCSTYVGTYYYAALTWVTYGAPRNPTCEPVTLQKVALP